MSTAGRGVTPASRFGISTRTSIVAAFAALVGLVACYGEFVLGYLGHRTWYDDGVYMGAAIQLSHGIMPYRDFVFLHPPGIVLALLPFAFLGRAIGTGPANEAARLLIAVLAVASVAVFARVARPRPILALAAGLAVFALHPDQLLADQAVYIEPLLILVCLVGTALIFDGEHFAASRARWWVGGAAFGVAGALKLWAVFPILAIIALALTMRRRRDATRFATAAAGAFLVVCAPFIFVAPRSFVHYLFVVQASRSDPGSATVTTRLGDLLDIPTPLQPNRLLVVAVVVIVMAVVVWSVVRTRRHPLSALERYSLTTAGLVIASFVAAGDYYEHYGAFAAPFLGLVASATVARLSTAANEESGHPNAAKHAGILLTSGVVVVTLVLVAYGAELLRTTTPNQDLSSHSMKRIASTIASRHCTVTDNVSILIMSGRFTAARPGCPRAIDPFGTDLALTNGNVGRVATSTAVRREWKLWLGGADTLVVNEPTLTLAAKADDWNRQVQQYARGHFAWVGRTGVVSIYERVDG